MWLTLFREPRAIDYSSKIMNKFQFFAIAYIVLSLPAKFEVLIKEAN